MKISIVFVICLFIGEGFTFTTDFTNVTRTKRQTKCKEFHFPCGSGECISDDNVCDGREDCKDGSDESLACKKNTCPTFLFACAYGACISSEHVCDGKKDCKDNSDEAPSLCNKTVVRPSSSNCDNDEFTCTNGKCINEGDLCDGIDNCLDGSDETVELCGSIKCPNYSYKCAYGACINADLRCNRAQDCIDNSDEVGCPGLVVTPTPPPVTPPTSPHKTPTGSDCVLPPYPQNGKWSLLSGVSGEYYPGDIVSFGTILQFSCNANYGLARDSASITFCQKNNSWSHSATCAKMCPPFPKKNHAIVQCSLDGQTISCDTPYEGTVARVKCSSLYQDPYLKSKPFNYCRDNSWDYQFPNCEPECGLRIGLAEKLIINGKDAEKGEFPWHVGIYHNNSNICGGSIISPKLILTAAHCFEYRNTNEYSVGAGKYYRNYNDKRDANAQYSNVSEIIIHKDYRGGIPHEAYDLAMLVLTKPLEMNSYALPICLDEPNFDLSNLNNKVGIVVGWGHTTETGAPADNLKYLEVGYKSEEACHLPTNMVTYYLPYAQDKLCAGVAKEAKSACKGDSGGGLVFEKDKRYYIRGIVSVGGTKGSGCNSNEFTLYTSADFHLATIEEMKSKYRS